jgi:biotin carboxylase
MSLLLLGPTDDYLRKVMAVDKSVIVLTETKRLTPWQLTTPCEIHLCSFKEIPELLLTAMSIAAATSVRAVISFTELGIVPAAIIGRLLGVPAPQLDASIVSRNKLLTRQALRKQGLTHVDFHEIAANGWHNERDHTVVVKPIDGTGSLDVHCVAPGDSVDLVPEQRYIMETWLSGKEFSCETFSIEGAHYLLAVTEKWLGGTNGLVETGHLIDPASFQLTDEQWAYLYQCLNAVGITDGPGHTELKIDGDSIDIIECHNRPGGDRIWSLVEIVTGFDMITAQVNLLLGNQVTVAIDQRGCAAIKYFELPPGTVQSVRMPEAFPAHVHWLDSGLRPGEKVTGVSNSFQRQGGIIVSAPDACVLRDRLSHELERIEVVVA